MGNTKYLTNINIENHIEIVLLPYIRYHLLHSSLRYSRYNGHLPTTAH